MTESIRLVKPIKPVKPERAHRILDAAADLVVRWGYDKTTVDDVARHAGVAKGTIYLHWSNREALFAALLRRERVAMLTEVRKALETTGATLHDLLRCLTLELLRRPLMKAAVLGDSEVLGRLLRQKGRLAATPEDIEGFFDTLSQAGATRSDLTPAEQVTIAFSTLYGFLLVAPKIGVARIPDDRLADLVAETVQRMLEPEAGPRRGGDAARAAAELLDHGLRVAEGKLNESLGGPPRTGGGPR